MTIRAALHAFRRPWKSRAGALFTAEFVIALVGVVVIAIVCTRLTQTAIFWQQLAADAHTSSRATAGQSASAGQSAVLSGPALDLIGPHGGESLGGYANTVPRQVLWEEICPGSEGAIQATAAMRASAHMIVYHDIYEADPGWAQLLELANDYAWIFYDHANRMAFDSQCVLGCNPVCGSPTCLADQLQAAVDSLAGYGASCAGNWPSCSGDCGCPTTCETSSDPLCVGAICGSSCSGSCCDEEYEDEGCLDACDLVKSLGAQVNAILTRWENQGTPDGTTYGIFARVPPANIPQELWTKGALRAAGRGAVWQQAVRDYIVRVKDLVDQAAQLTLDAEEQEKDTLTSCP